MNNPIKFYTDEHVPQVVIKRLRQEGIEVLTTQEAGMMSASDTVIKSKSFSAQSNLHQLSHLLTSHYTYDRLTNQTGTASAT